MAEEKKRELYPEKFFLFWLIAIIISSIVIFSMPPGTYHSEMYPELANVTLCCFCLYASLIIESCFQKHEYSCLATCLLRGMSIFFGIISVSSYCIFMSTYIVEHKRRIYFAVLRETSSGQMEFDGHLMLNFIGFFSFIIIFCFLNRKRKGGAGGENI